MVSYILGIEAPLTSFILLTSVIIISRFVFYQKRPELPFLVKYFLFFLMSFIFISTISLLLYTNNLHSDTSLVKLYRNYFSTFVIFLAFYFGSVYFLMQFGTYQFLKFIILLFLLTTIFTVFTNDLGMNNLYIKESSEVGESSRQSGLFGNPNEAGSFGLYFLVILLSSALVFKSHKYVLLLMSLLAAYSIFVTFSKAAIGTGGLVLVIYFVFNLKNVLRIGRSNRRITLIAFVSVVFIASTIFSQWENIFASFTQGQQKRALSFFLLLQGEVSKKTTSERTITFQHGWEMIQSSPVIGNGFGSFHRFAGGPLQLGVHNTYLLITGESGFIPIILYITLLFLLISASSRIENPGIRFLVIGFCVVFFISVSGTGHNALYDRVSNAVLAIIIAIIYYFKSLKCAELRAL
jgi:O-antigen ligase